MSAALSYAETHRRSLVDRDAFWRERAALIDWQTPFSKVLDYGKPPFARWFVGGRTNLCHNAIDRHLAMRRDQPALVFVSTETGQRSSFTYGELHAAVNTFAAMLKAQGVGRGDRVLIYMPMIPEAVFAMLADRAHRRHPLGGLRRIRGGKPGDAHRRRHAESADHRRRRHARRERWFRIASSSTKP